MTDRDKREKAIKGLENCAFKSTCNECPYIEDANCSKQMKIDAIALLNSSFTPKEVYDTVIEHGQHDKRFKLGGTIDYTFTEAVDILNNELMCKAGDM